MKTLKEFLNERKLDATVIKALQGVDKALVKNNRDTPVPIAGKIIDGLMSAFDDSDLNPLKTMLPAMIKNGDLDRVPKVIKAVNKLLAII